MKAMARIQIMHEVEDVPAKAKLQQRLEAARRIIFLGFHYHADNLRKLLSLTGRKRHPDLEVFGSTFNLTPAECDDAKQRVCTALAISPENVHIGADGNLTCYNYIRQFVRFV